jgi:hypothetical protein
MLKTRHDPGSIIYYLRSFAILFGVNRLAKSFIGLVSFLFFNLFFAVAFSAALDLQKDINGWTIFTPSSDSRIIYIATNGDDSTGKFYTPTSPEVGSDPFKPSGSIQPYATFTAAFAQAREGAPDWILFKRGDSFTITETLGINPRSGRSVTEPSLTGAYGANGGSPILKFPATSQMALRMQRSAPNWIAVAGLDFYSSTRDPLLGEYAGTSGTNQLGIWIYHDSATPYKGYLIEGCKFRFFDDSIITSVSIPVVGLVFRRNIFSDSYAGPGQSHCQGLLTTRQNLILEDNIFIHNGWRDPAGGPIGEATVFNHNVYNSYPTGATYIGNTFIQGSNMNTKFTAGSSANANPIVIENNLYIDGQQGIGFGNNTSGYPAFSDITVQENVFTNIGRSDHLQSIAWGIDLGFDTTGTQIRNNLLLHQNNSNVTNNFSFAIAGVQTNINFLDNIVYGFQYANGLAVSDKGAQLSQGATKTNVSFANNKIINLSHAGFFVTAQTNVNGISFSNNTYFGDKSSTALFHAGTKDYSLSDWQSLTGDNSIFEQVTFPDPTRSIETYMASIGETATIDAFIAKCRAQDRYNWDPRFTAAEVNKWIKGGFFKNEVTETPPAGVQANIIK